MPFNPNFTVSQIPSNPALLIITDTSTGSDPLIDSRRIYITNYNGDAVVPQGVLTSYIPWTYPGNSLTISLLSEDAALNVRVDWLSAAGGVLYTVNTNYCFSQYSKQFLYYLIQLQSLTYNIIQDNNYWGNVGIYWTNVVGAINSVEVGNDIYSSQVCLNRANFMAQNQATYF